MSDAIAKNQQWEPGTHKLAYPFCIMCLLNCMSHVRSIKPVLLMARYQEGEIDCARQLAQFLTIIFLDISPLGPIWESAHCASYIRSGEFLYSRQPMA